jgi:hypothetical protein
MRIEEVIKQKRVAKAQPKSACTAKKTKPKPFNEPKPDNLS